MKRLFSFLLFALFAFCACDNGRPIDEKSQTLRINFVNGDPPSLHPHVGIDIRACTVQKAVFEGLMRLDSNGMPQPAAASSVEISPDRLTYTFTLRPHKWSNGESVTAFDFERTWKAAMLPNSDCRRAECFYPIKNAEKIKCGELSIEEVGIRALDASTLVVELENPTPYFLDLTAAPLFSPVYDEDEEPTIFNGAFIVDSWKREKMLCLVPNPHYWDRGSVKLHAIEVSMVQDPRTVLALFEEGSLDLTGDPFSPIPLEAKPGLLSQDLIKSKEVARTYNIYCNTDHSVLKNAKLRRALAMAINRRDLTDHVIFGQIPFRSPIPRCHSLVEETTFYQDGDLTKAKALFHEALEELGVTLAEFPPLVLQDSNQMEFRVIDQTVQRAWEEAFGIEVRLENNEVNILVSNLYKRNYQLAGCPRSALFNDPMYHLSFYRYGDSLVNWSGWDDKEYQDLLTLAETTPDSSVRNQALLRAEKILLEEMPVIPVYVHNYHYLQKEELDGVLFTDLGYLDFKHARFN